MQSQDIFGHASFKMFSALLKTLSAVLSFSTGMS